MCYPVHLTTKYIIIAFLFITHNVQYSAKFQLHNQRKTDLWYIRWLRKAALGIACLVMKQGIAPAHSRYIALISNLANELVYNAQFLLVSVSYYFISDLWRLISD